MKLLRRSLDGAGERVSATRFVSLYGLAVLVAVFGALTMFGAAAAESADLSTVSGVVRDRDGTPVANEFVQLNAGALYPYTYTNANGEYSITATPGQYSLRLAGFDQPCGHDVNATGQLEFGAGQTTLNLTLPNLYLDVTVHDSVGIPVANAKVTLENYGTTFEVAPGITMAGGTGCTNGVTTNASGVARLSLFASVSNLSGAVRLPSGLTIPFTHGPLTTDSSVTVNWSGRIDTTPPVLTEPVFTPPAYSIESLWFVPATSPAGAVVSWTITATDDLDGSLPVSCWLESGTLLPISPPGDSYEIECTATDTSGNIGYAAPFFVHVLSAQEQITELIATVESYNLDKLGTSLTDKLVTAQRMVEAGKTMQAIASLDSFLAQLKSQAGKGLTADQASHLSAEAMRIEAVLGA